MNCFKAITMFFLMLGFMLAGSQIGQAYQGLPVQYYLLEDQSPQVMELWPSIMDEVQNKGRGLVLKRKKNTLNIPASLKEHLRPVDLSDVRYLTFDQLVSVHQPDPRLALYLDNVSRERIVEVVEQLAGKESRRVGFPGNIQVTAWLKQFMQQLGLEATEQCFASNLCNVLGVKKGTSDEYVLIAAHLDSVGHSFAGADDNASGIGGLIEIARLTAGLNGKRGLIFFATNGEESGLLGAKHYVKDAAARGVLSKIKFVINMDMIGYNQNGLVDIETNQPFEKEARWMAELVQNYTSLRPNITMPAWGSDHVPFLQKNIPSILTIEYWKTKTPCYHQACDSVDHLNFDYAREIVRLNTAAVILQAELALP